MSLYPINTEIWISLLDPVSVLLRGYAIWYISLLGFVNGLTDGSRALIQHCSLISPCEVPRGQKDAKTDLPFSESLPCLSCLHPMSPFFTHHFVGSGQSCGFFFHATPLRVRLFSQHATGVHSSLSSSVPGVLIAVVFLDSCGTCGD